MGETVRERCCKPGVVVEPEDLLDGGRRKPVLRDLEQAFESIRERGCALEVEAQILQLRQLVWIRVWCSHVGELR